MASVAPSDSPALKPDASFSGPVGKRKCTDVLFMLLLIACWVAMTGLGLVGLGKIDGCANGIGPGEPKRLWNGIDYQGDLCGLDNTKALGCNATAAVGAKDNSALPYAYMPVPSDSSLVLCLATCPGAGFTADVSTALTDVVCKYGVAQPTTAGEAAAAIGAVPSASDDCFWGLRTRAIGQYCVPSALGTALAAGAANAMGANSSAADLAADRSTLSKVASDFDKASGAILGFGVRKTLVLSSWVK